MEAWLRVDGFTLLVVPFSKVVSVHSCVYVLRFSQSCGVVAGFGLWVLFICNECCIYIYIYQPAHARFYPGYTAIWCS